MKQNSSPTRTNLKTSDASRDKFHFVSKDISSSPNKKKISTIDNHDKWSKPTLPKKIGRPHQLKKSALPMKTSHPCWWAVIQTYQIVVQFHHNPLGQIMVQFHHGLPQIKRQLQLLKLLNYSKYVDKGDQKIKSKKIILREFYFNKDSSLDSQLK